MPPKQPLRSLLRKEVMKDRRRIQPPKPTSPPILTEEDLPDLADEDDVDSVWREPIRSKDEILKDQLDDLLSRPTATDISSTRKNSASVNPALQLLKEELKAVIYAEAEASSGEKEANRRQRPDLLEEIRKIEAKEKNASRRASVITPGKELLDSPKKQKRQRDPEENLDDLDGEERLRRGLPLRKQKVVLSGRWNSSKHDYFPGLGAEREYGEGREALTLRDVSVEDRVLFRKEFAELGEELAKEERRKQRKFL